MQGGKTWRGTGRRRSAVFPVPIKVSLRFSHVGERRNCTPLQKSEKKRSRSVRGGGGCSHSIHVTSLLHFLFSVFYLSLSLSQKSKNICRPVHFPSKTSTHICQLLSDPTSWIPSIISMSESSLKDSFWKSSMRTLGGFFFLFFSKLFLVSHPTFPAVFWAVQDGARVFLRTRILMLESLDQSVNQP